MLLYRLLVTALCLLVLSACGHRPPQPRLATPGATGVAGAVTDTSGQPAAGGYVYAYRNPRSGLRGPADFEAAVGADGRYFLELAEGRYYLVARLRRSGADVGAPRPGDAWAMYARNPVEVRAGETSHADFVLKEVTQPRLFKEGSLGSGDTGFSGRIVDGTGQPVSGAVVLAYRNTDFRRMPDFTSAAVGTDGRFTLYIPAPGHFCLVARTRTRGQPTAGEPFGVLADGEAGCRNVEGGEILEVGDIILTPFRN